MNEKIDFYIAIDTVASNTWPAESSISIDNWLLRASQGVTKRANSVLAIGEYPNDPNWLAKIEQFYQELGLPAIFHISDASPEGLDEILHTKGYVLETPCLMMTAASRQVSDNANNKMMPNKSSIQMEWAEAADVEWLDAFLMLEQFPEERRGFYSGLFERMPSPKGFLKLKLNDQIIALGTAIVEDEWAGFVNVVIHEGHRGKGLGYVLMHALTEWSLENGATNQYLQVVTSNKPAVTLYEKLDYQARYGYHYRIKYDLQPLVSS
ncbi:GNAT family N-acetyltransferase [Paenibacillus sp. V4I5]|uniref:GNAT family N-acetyltransferase n=1 Tax=Paenibacillus sp. V4I5 TaxID=3042306 RepID=UPI00278E7D87|nr:GNAT family N-acetyltransferase [Paenibacillus sp. V4I5]MDQ0915454.1 GNAT superfamily N-acetyltransferase [Paenibacillus sp. V4I5]